MFGLLACAASAPAEAAAKIHELNADNISNRRLSLLMYALLVWGNLSNRPQPFSSTRWRNTASSSTRVQASAFAQFSAELRPDSRDVQTRRCRSGATKTGITRARFGHNCKNCQVQST